MSDPQCTLLIADDDGFVRDDLADLLGESKEYRLLFSGTAKETWEKLAGETPDLVLLDLKFPDSQDLSLLRRIRSEKPEVDVIILSSQTGSVPQIVEAIQLGAFDFVPKPFVREELRNRVEKALSLKKLRRSQDYLLKELQERDGVDTMMGGSAAMVQVRETIRKLADVDGCVLIRGESGTGKELVARALHYLSRRRSSPFIVVNCAAIPETLIESFLFGHRRGAFTGAVDSAKGMFEAAEDGTIFLDEIGDMPLAQQASLLRVLEYRRYTPVGENRQRECRARFVLATNRDLRESVKEGRFREDLFYRINVATIQMPPLRTRPEDIATLAAYFCKRLAAEMGRLPMRVSDEALDLFGRYDWPGNVRELKNILEAAIMLAEPLQESIALRDLPPELLAMSGAEKAGGAAASEAEQREKEELIRTLQQCRGNQTLAARLLRCHRNTIRAKIRQFGLSELSPGEG